MSLTGEAVEAPGAAARRRVRAVLVGVRRVPGRQRAGGALVGAQSRRSARPAPRRPRNPTSSPRRSIRRHSVPSAFEPVRMSCSTGAGEPVHCPLMRWPRSSRKTPASPVRACSSVTLLATGARFALCQGPCRSGPGRGSAGCRSPGRARRSGRRARCARPGRRRRRALTCGVGSGEPSEVACRARRARHEEANDGTDGAVGNLITAARHDEDKE